MIFLDTVRISTPLSILKVFDENFFEEKMINNELCFVAIQQYLPIGISEIVIHPIKQKVIFTFSAKILKANYGKLINVDTFQQVVDEFNGFEGLKIDGSIMLEGEILRSDSTVNLNNFTKPISTLVKALLAVNSKKVYQPTNYTNESVIFDTTNKTKVLKWQNTFYDKEKELLEPNNKRFSQYCDPYQFHGVFRNELRLDHHSIAKRAFEIEKKGSPTLLEILLSDAKPNLVFFQKFIRGSMPPLFTEGKTDRQKHHQAFLQTYYGDMCFDGVYNLKLIDLWLRDQYIDGKVKGEYIPGHYVADSLDPFGNHVEYVEGHYKSDREKKKNENAYYRKIKQVKQYLDEINEDRGARTNFNSVLDEIEERMEEAYQ